MFCGGEGAGNASGLLAFGTMAGFRTDLNALEIRSKYASPKELRTTSKRVSTKETNPLQEVRRQMTQRVTEL